MALTERQQEVKDLMEQGMKPADIAKRLGISTNAVYQQIRRMRGGKAGKSGRQSSGNRSQAASPAPATPASANGGEAPKPRPVTPEKALRDRKAEFEGELREAAREMEQAERAAERARNAHTQASERLTVEIERIDAALSVLSGEKVAHSKPQPKAAPAATTNGKGNGKDKPAKDAPAADATTQPPAESQQAPESEQGGQGSEQPAAAAA